MGITGEETQKQDSEEVKISKRPFNDRSKSQRTQDPIWKNKNKKTQEHNQQRKQHEEDRGKERTGWLGRETQVQTGETK